MLTRQGKQIAAASVRANLVPITQSEVTNANLGHLPGPLWGIENSEKITAEQRDSPVADCRALSSSLARTTLRATASIFITAVQVRIPR